MQTSDLQKLLDLRLGDICSTFVGAKNEVPILTPNKAAAIIFNTETSNLAGQHWVAAYIDSKRQKALYYDSTGTHIQPILLKTLCVTPFTSVQETNRNLEQPISSALCGLFCVTWLDIVSKHGVCPDFFSNQDINDILVLLYLNEELEIIFK